MAQVMRAIKAEFLKLKGSKVPLWTGLAVVAYSTLAIAGGFMWKRPDAADQMAKIGGAWTEAAARGYYTSTWDSLLRQNPQGIAGGVAMLLFGFVTAYVFGRERKEGTDATLLTAPVQRRSFAVAKLVVVAVWVIALTLFWFTFQTAGIALSAPSGFAWSLVWQSFGQTLQALLLLMALLPFVAFVALLGKPGYLKPMIAAILLQPTSPVVSTGNAHLFPPSMPVLIAGAAWLPVVSDTLEPISWLIALAVLVAGVALVLWKFGRIPDAQ